MVLVRGWDGKMGLVKGLDEWVFGGKLGGYYIGGFNHHYVDDVACYHHDTIRHKWGNVV